MGKIKHTKNELKAQREALTRFERFLPMLQLKKQLLQAEIQIIDAKLAEKKAEENKLRSELNKWIKLFSEDLSGEASRLGEASGGAWVAKSEPSDIENLVFLKEIKTEEGNIAGVDIPVLVDAIIEKKEYDLFVTPAWYDEAVVVLEKLIRLRIELEILEEQCRLITEELRITSQRVNLFEKVKIPECKENIRVIKIFLGDQQTAAVVRAKIAKSHTMAYEYEDAAA